jgi:hypothetical protein
MVGIEKIPQTLEKSARRPKPTTPDGPAKARMLLPPQMRESFKV